MGWVSPSINILLSDESPLTTGPLTYDQLAWLGSINNIGAFCGIITFGGITMRLGCKRCILLLGVPSVVYWILILIGQTYNQVLFARFLAGLYGGIGSNVRIFNFQCYSLIKFNTNMLVIRWIAGDTRHLYIRNR